MSTSLYERSLRALFARVADADFRALLALLNPEFSFLCTPSIPVSNTVAAGISSPIYPSLSALPPASLAAIPFVQQPGRTGVVSHVDDALLHLEDLCAPLPALETIIHEQHASPASYEVRSLL